jgi:hypothetical protein
MVFDADRRIYVTAVCNLWSFALVNALLGHWNVWLSFVPLSLKIWIITNCMVHAGSKRPESERILVFWILCHFLGPWMNPIWLLRGILFGLSLVAAMYQTDHQNALGWTVATWFLPLHYLLLPSPDWPGAFYLGLYWLILMFCVQSDRMPLYDDFLLQAIWYIPIDVIRLSGEAVKWLARLNQTFVL